MVATTVPSNPIPTNNAPPPFGRPENSGRHPFGRLNSVLRKYALDYFLDIADKDELPFIPCFVENMACDGTIISNGEEQRCGHPLVLQPMTSDRVKCQTYFSGVFPTHTGIDCISDRFAHGLLEFREEEGYPRLVPINDNEVVVQCPKCEQRFPDETTYDLHRREHPYHLPLTKSEWCVYRTTPRSIVDIANKLVAECLASHTGPVAAFQAAQEKLDPLCSHYGFADTECRIVLERVVNTHFDTEEELWLK